LRLTLVSAPADYGKSTLVSCWLEASTIFNAWVSLDENDNELSQFLSYLLAAIRSMFPDVCQKTLDAMNALALPSVSTLAVDLINVLFREIHHQIPKGNTPPAVFLAGGWAEP